MGRLVVGGTVMKPLITVVFVGVGVMDWRMRSGVRNFERRLGCVVFRSLEYRSGLRLPIFC